MIVFADCQPLWWDIPAHSTLQDAFLHEVYLGTTLQLDNTYIVDELPLQVIVTKEETIAQGLVFFLEFQDGTTALDITNDVTEIQITDKMYVYYLQQSNTTPFYQTYVDKISRFVVAWNTGTYYSNWFALTECEETLTDTAVLRYSNNSNVTGYNTYFYPKPNTTPKKPLVFTWRVPAGLKPQGFAPLLDSDEFRNQRQESVSLYSLAYGKYVLTIGHAEGVPYYYADLLNKIFSLDSVELYDPDADIWREVRRSGNAVPQLAETYTGSGMFHITLEIELVQPQIELS